MPDTLTAEEIVVARKGRLWVAPENTALPADIDATLDAAFVNIGFASEDGVKFRRDPNLDPKYAWQASSPVLYLPGSVTCSAGFGLLQWNRDTVPLAFGGGAITATANGWRYDPPDPGSIDIRCMVAEWYTQEGFHWMAVLERCMPVEPVETDLQRTEMSPLPITLAGLSDPDDLANDGEPWYILSNAPGMEPEGSS